MRLPIWTVAAVVLISLLSATPVPVDAGLGADIYVKYTPTTYQCLRNKGYKWIILRLLRSYGGVDADAITSAKNAQAAGYPFVDYYLFLCNGRDGFISQANKAIAEARRIGVPFSRLWLDVETNPSPQCGWGTSSSALASQCQKVKQVISSIRAAGIKVGIYSSRHMWSQTVGNNCIMDTNDLPMWYAHYQTPPQLNFNRFQTFGGWSVPTMKQFADKIPDCGVHADGNWFPDANLPSIGGGSGSVPPPPAQNPPPAAAPVQNDEQCAARRGQCKEVSRCGAPSTVQSGLCPSYGASIKCCIPPSGNVVPAPPSPAVPVPVSPGAEPTTKDGRQAYVRNILKQVFTRLGERAISGIMGNIEAETGTFDYRTLQRGGNGYGLFQFDYMRRYYLQWLGARPDSALLQITWAHRIIYIDMSIMGAGNAAKLRTALEGNGSVTDKTLAFMNIFEKPGVPHSDRRINSANADYAKFGGNRP